MSKRRKWEYYQQFREFATECEQKYLDAMKEHKGQKPAAQALGVNDSSVNRAMKTLEARAVKRGYSPQHDMTHAAPEGFKLKGTSTLYDKDGKMMLQWVKTMPDVAKLEEIARIIVEGLAEQIAGRKAPEPMPALCVDHLLAVYPMGDPHIGMYAWADETGDDFDCDIAERDIQQGIGYLVGSAPPTQHALIINLGDFFHSDTLDNMTRRSGNVLDVDTRWPRVMQIGVNIMVYCIDEALKKHQQVTVINEIGNHDDQSAFVLSLVLNAYYRNEPRVTIDMSPMPFHYYRWGRVLIGVTHGHNTKPDLLGPIMATDRATDWGETTHRYWYVGHIHHKDAKEYHGCVVESFRTLAAKDAWHAAKGYRSGRDMMCIVHHQEHGEVDRHRFDISMVRKGAA